MKASIEAYVRWRTRVLCSLFVPTRKEINKSASAKKQTRKQKKKRRLVGMSFHFSWFSGATNNGCHVPQTLYGSLIASVFVLSLI